jgi:hypothetical protein
MAALVFDNDEEEPTTRFEEVMVLESMYEEEMEFSFGKRYEFKLLNLKIPVDDKNNDAILCDLHATLPPSYPICKSNFIRLEISTLERAILDELVMQLRTELDTLNVEEMPMKVLHSIEYLKENLHLYISKQKDKSRDNVKRTETADSNRTGSKHKDDNIICNGFMREWCSFVSLYKDSYISGPNRFEVLDTLANHRNLNITGMAIAGKPGGLVVEGRESDVIEFMNLMRTEFFETLNPRGRKLTTRLQERWPLDDEIMRYDVAKARKNIMEDIHQSVKRSKEIANKVVKANKKAENERLQKWEEDDKLLVKTFEGKRKLKMNDLEMEALLFLGPPTVSNIKKNTSSNETTVMSKKQDNNKNDGSSRDEKIKIADQQQHVYHVLKKTYSKEEIDLKRKFQSFTVLTGGNNSGYESAYQDAGVLLTREGLKYGFDAMFSYRFS